MKRLRQRTPTKKGCVPKIAIVPLSSVRRPKFVKSLAVNDYCKQRLGKYWKASNLGKTREFEGGQKIQHFLGEKFVNWKMTKKLTLN